MDRVIISLAWPNCPGAADRIGLPEKCSPMTSAFLLSSAGCFLPYGCPFCLSQVLVQAIKEAKEQHPDMSVTKVVVHQETEISDE